jgi:subtilisin
MFSRAWRGLSLLGLFWVLAFSSWPAGVGSGQGAAVQPSSNQVAQLAAQAQQQGSVRVIARLSLGFSAEAAQGSLSGWVQRLRIARAQGGVIDRLKKHGAVRARRYTNLPLLALDVTPDQLQDLLDNPDVVAVQADVPVPPSLASSIPLIGADSAWADGYTGSGWAVAILDTGVDSSHPFLSSKVVAEACFSGGGSTTNSLCPNGQPTQTGTGAGANCPASIEGCSHGTHVAGIAAGSGSSFSGVAKDADVIAVQIFSEFTGATCSGFGLPSPCALTYTSDQISGLDWVYSQRTSYNIASVNMSLGGASYTSTASCDSANASEKLAIDNLRSAGIATVIAAGNSGYTSALSAPACISSAISVGASTDSDTSGGADKVASYSNVASFLSLFAPGSTITSSVPGGGYATWNGTSMAAPHVAGAWALMKSKLPSASVDDVLAALESTGVIIEDTRSGGTVSRPRIQVDAALSALGATPTATWTDTTTPSATQTASSTPTSTSTATPTDTSTPTDTPTPTWTWTPSPTITSTSTFTPGPSPTFTFTPTVTDTAVPPTPTKTPISGQIFEDVPSSYWAYNYINALYNAGYVAGCSASPRLYCPDQILLRSESAVFVLRGSYGAIADPPYPPPAKATFKDVKSSFWGFGWIESLWKDGFTAGCGTDPLIYCPNQQHSRAEGSVFFLRIKNGSDYVPPAPSGLFDDVDVGAWYAPWVEAAYNQGLLPACNDSPLKFCPEDKLNRAWAAYMMVQAKGGLPLGGASVTSSPTPADSPTWTPTSTGIPLPTMTPTPTASQAAPDPTSTPTATRTPSPTPPEPSSTPTATPTPQ